jgi:hypothetical protein
VENIVEHLVKLRLLRYLVKFMLIF